MNYSFVIVHFNTPELTTCLISSIRKYHKNEIIIFDNSTIRKFPKENLDLFENVTYLDNTEQQILNFGCLYDSYVNKKHLKQNNLGSAKHCLTIDFLIKSLNKNFILLDSDVLLKKPIDFIQEEYLTIGEISYLEQKNNKKRKLRILPYIQFFNTEKLNENKISYFNKNKICGISNTDGYDTGASFYELLKNKYSNCIKTNIKIENYIVHFGGGSWCNKSWQSFLIKNKKYWN